MNLLLGLYGAVCQIRLFLRIQNLKDLLGRIKCAWRVVDVPAEKFAEYGITVPTESLTKDQTKVEVKVKNKKVEQPITVKEKEFDKENTKYFLSALLSCGYIEKNNLTYSLTSLMVSKTNLLITSLRI